MAVTRTQVETHLNDVFRALNNFTNYLRRNTPRFTGTTPSDESTFRTNLTNEFVYHRNMAEQIELFRQSHVSTLARAAEFLTPGLQEYAAFIGVPETDPQGILDRLYLDFIAASTREIKSRGFTLGSPAAGGSNAGNGTINRIRCDEEAYLLDAQTPDTKTAECVADENSGAVKQEEVFEFRGKTALRDPIIITGSGQKKRIKAISARDSLQFIANPSFSEYSGPVSAPTDLAGWVINASGSSGTLANCSIDPAYYRDFEGDSVPKSLKILAGGVAITIQMEQKFNFRRVQVDRNRPWYLQFAVFRPDAGTTGNFQPILGSGATTSINLTTITAGTWGIIRLNSPFDQTNNKNNWFRNFYNLQLNRLGFTVANLAANKYVLVDDVIFAPMDEFDGDFYSVVGGADTTLGESGANGNKRFLLRDVFTWTDTNNDDGASEGIIQKWLWRAFGRYLPHTTGVADWVDPT